MVQLSAILAVTCCLLINSACGRTGFGPGEQDWAHVTVREGAHMFYWLYYTTANVSSYTDRPLAIWLQGGPGASSTGYGNFEEFGPLDLNLNYRNFTWVKDMNVMFIDNPVGSGFSYVDDKKYLTTTNKQIALDLVEMMKAFYKTHPEFKKVPLHIFCESYGGKMSPEFALELYYSIQKGEIESNLESVIMGDPWFSPIDSVLSWAPFLLHTGIVDQIGHDKIMTAANVVQADIDAGRWTQSTTSWGRTQGVVLDQSKGVDFYNILKHTRGYSWYRSVRNLDEAAVMYRTLVDYDSDAIREASLDSLMNNQVRAALNISKSIVWGSQSQITFSTLSGDFMKPVLDIVETLLNSTDVNVGVLSGHLDLICATPGTVNAIAKLNWPGKQKYDDTPRAGISVNGILEGYTKESSRFSMHWVNRAGHMVPYDNPAGMSYILRKYTKFG